MLRQIMEPDYEVRLLLQQSEQFRPTTNDQTAYISAIQKECYAKDL